MTAFCVWLFIISSLIGLAWYIYDKYKIAEKEITERESSLKSYAALLEKNEQDRKKDHEVCLAQISLKKAELVSYHQHSLEKLGEAQKIENATKNKIILLQKQINKLQDDLYNARQRSKRLAKKAENRL